jgi:hypothetical protein
LVVHLCRRRSVALISHYQILGQESAGWPPWPAAAKIGKGGRGTDVQYEAVFAAKNTEMKGGESSGFSWRYCTDCEDRF